MSLAPGIKKKFTEQLLKWHWEDNSRDLPWKNEKDPYKIWLSEVILQQTRAEQGRPYYEKFITAYPDVHLLAQAPEDEVFRLWQGLGYYNRCRNLLAAARTISEQYGGIFPDTYESILELKGVGGYTAAAIASFAFNLPHAVLDGNVYRILSRYFGIDTETDSTSGKKLFQVLADQLMDREHPAAYNQAIMDFGATVCVPKSPKCPDCVLSKHCEAYKKDMVALLPVKKKKLVIRNRHMHYFILEHGDEVYLQQRTEKDIWQSLFEFYLIETEGDYEANEAWENIKKHALSTQKDVFLNRQKLTHQLIISSFHIIELDTKLNLHPQGIWVKKDLIKKYAFPKTILSFLNRKKYF